MNSLHFCKLQIPSNAQKSYAVATQERKDNQPQSHSPQQTRSIGAHTNYWATGKSLKIAISRVSDEGFDAVKNAIEKWAPYVNLNFNFIDLDDNDELYEGDIRIYLGPNFNDVGRSLIGTDALAAPAFEPTMWLGTNYTEPNYESLVIHEFGHALGLLHEHQHPDTTIPWDRETTYRLLQNNYGLSRDAVNAAFFPLTRNTNYTYASYDRESVMHYQIPNEFTLGDWEQPRNKQLSAGDIAFARTIYP